MPHSEYPSGSACLCEVIQEFVDAYFVRTDGPNPQFGTTDKVLKGSSTVEPGAQPAQDVVLSWANMTQLSDECSRSRLDGGMHFTASVPAAEALCEGIGDAGFAFATDLIDNDWVPGQPKLTPAPTQATAGPASPPGQPILLTEPPTPTPAPTCRALCDAFYASPSGGSRTDTAPWCNGCTAGGINCFTGSKNCYANTHGNAFCTLNMAGTVCQLRPGGSAGANKRMPVASTTRGRLHIT